MKFPLKPKCHSQYGQPKPAAGSGVDPSLLLSQGRAGASMELGVATRRGQPRLPVQHLSLTALPPQLMSHWTKHSYPVGKGHFSPGMLSRGREAKVYSISLKGIQQDHRRGDLCS